MTTLGTDAVQMIRRFRQRRIARQEARKEGGEQDQPVGRLPSPSRKPMVFNRPDGQKQPIKNRIDDRRGRGLSLYDCQRPQSSKMKTRSELQFRSGKPWLRRNPAGAGMRG